MFDDVYDMETCMDMLILKKTIFDVTGENKGGQLDAEYVFSDAYEHIIDVAEDVVAYTPKYYDFNTVFKIQFDCMPEFYNLCRRYARLHGISLKNTCYYQDAEDFVNEYMQYVGSPYFTWFLNVPKKICKKKSYFLYVEVCEESFMEYNSLAIEIYEIRKYYEDKTKELRRIVKREETHANFKQIISAERKAA